jgi:fructoselysine-6-P-deglycase FrlB-like protein
MAVAGLISEALEGGGPRTIDVRSEQALEATLRPRRTAACIGISHEGSTRATLLAMEAVRAAGGSTALITARRERAAASAANHTFVTPLVDRSWCHTVGYFSPLLAGAAIAAALQRVRLDPGGLERALREVLALEPEARRLAQGLSGVDRIISAGSGADRSPARELALKLSEGPRIPAQMLDLETTLHGHLAAADRQTGLVLVASGDERRPLARAAILAQAARAIGLRVGAILSPEAGAAIDPAFTDAGRVVLPGSLRPHGLIGRLGGAAIALQQLTLALVHLRGINPDLIRTEEDGYREASRIASEKVDW